MPPHLAALLLQVATPATPSPWWDMAKYLSVLVSIGLFFLARHLGSHDKAAEALRSRNEQADRERETMKEDIKKLKEGHDNHEKRFEGLVRNDEKLGDRVELMAAEVLKTRELANENKGAIGYVKEGLGSLERGLQSLRDFFMSKS